MLNTLLIKSHVLRVVKSSWMPAKVATYSVSIGQLLCLAFLYGRHFLHKISLDWLLTLTTQPPPSKPFDNADVLLSLKPKLGTTMANFFPK